jgi:peptide/nickel transport system substrate-binding protein
MIRSFLLSIVLLGTLLFQACNNNPSNSSTKTNKVNIRLEAAANIIHPLMPSSGYARYVAEDVFQTLATFDPVTTELIPRLVVALPTAVAITDGPHKGGISYSFELLEAAAWDNGSPITAHDFEFTLKLILHPLLPNKLWRSYFDQIAAVQINPETPKKCTIIFKEHYFLALESLCQAPIYPAYHYDPNNTLQSITISDLLDPQKAAAIAKDPAQIAFFEQFGSAEMGTSKDKMNGSGPYKVVFFDPEQGVTLVKKANWWGTALATQYPALAAYPDTIQYLLVKAEDAAINMLQTGELDLVANVNTQRFLEMQNNPAFQQNYTFSTNAPASYNRIIINTKDPILADKRVRKALAMAVDYDYIINSIQQGMAQATVGPIHPSKNYYAKDLPNPSLQVEKAQALLAEAGWKDTDQDGILDKEENGKKKDLRISLLSTTGTSVVDQLTANLQKSFLQVGIQLELKPMDLTSITKETVAGNFQLASGAAALSPGFVDLRQLYHSKNLAPKGDNRACIALPELDQAMDQLATTTDEAERNQLYLQVQAILADEVPEIYLYAPKSRLIASKHFDHQATTLRPGYVARLSKLKK